MITRDKTRTTCKTSEQQDKRPKTQLVRHCIYPWCQMTAGLPVLGGRRMKITSAGIIFIIISFSLRIARADCPFWNYNWLGIILKLGCVTPIIIIFLCSLIFFGCSFFPSNHTSVQHCNIKVQFVFSYRPQTFSFDVSVYCIGHDTNTLRLLCFPLMYNRVHPESTLCYNYLSIYEIDCVPSYWTIYWFQLIPATKEITRNTVNKSKKKKKLKMYKSLSSSLFTLLQDKS